MSLGWFLVAVAVVLAAAFAVVASVVMIVAGVLELARRRRPRGRHHSGRAAPAGPGSRGRG